MTEKQTLEIFSTNLRKLLKERNITQVNLAKQLAVSSGTVSMWCMGKTAPRMDKIDMICDYFGVNRSDLLEDHTNDGYYINPESAKVAQELFEDKELRVLFDAAKDITPDQLRAVRNLLLSFKKTQEPNDD